MIHASRSRLLLVLLAALLGACRLSQTPEEPPLPLSLQVRWSGKTAARYSDSIPKDANRDRTGMPVHVHSFAFSGTDSLLLRLKEYRHAYEAYAEFEKSASAEALAAGFYRERNALVFHHGKFLGELEYARPGLVPSRFLKENLAFHGEELFAKPEEFTAFPLLGRIQHSERVIARHFLGKDWQGPVFTVGYRCNSDTGTAFRAFAQNSDSVKSWLRGWQGRKDTLDWGREIRFQGADEFRRPLIFWFFSEEVMGFEGCFDSLLTHEYAEKMQKTAVLWPKP